MPKHSKTTPLYASNFAINLYSNLVGLIAGGVVTYFSHDGSAWVKPLLFGGSAWLITFCSILAIRFMSRLPKKVDLVTLENIGRRIRDWLDEFNLTVKNVHEPDADFFYIVTTDGGKKISLFRNLTKNSDYVYAKGLITSTEDEKKFVASMNSDEQIALRLAIQLELSRAVMGYKTENMLEELTIFKRIPITPTLTAEEVLNVMFEVEAMIGTIFTIGALSIHRHNINQKLKEDVNETGVQKGSGGAKDFRDDHGENFPRPQNVGPKTDA